MPSVRRSPVSGSMTTRPVTPWKSNTRSSWSTSSPSTVPPALQCTRLSASACAHTASYTNPHKLSTGANSRSRSPARSPSTGS
eukprot:1839438-Rhodomonas_salina.1